MERSVTTTEHIPGEVLVELLARTDVLVYAKDLAGTFLFVNAALEAVLPVPGGLLGRSDHELFAADVADIYRAHDAVIAATGQPEQFAETLTHADGSLHAYRSTKFPLRDHTGAVYAIAGVSTDVTVLTAAVDELTVARAALEEAEQRWRALVEFSPVAVAVVDGDGWFAYANPEALTLYGIAETRDMGGPHFLDFMPPASRDEMAVLFAQVLAGEQQLRGLRWALRRLDGHELTVEVNAVAVMHRGRASVQVEAHDVSVQAGAVAAVELSERQFRAVFAGSPVGIGLLNDTGQWMEVNSSLASLVGRRPEDLIDHAGMAIAHPDDQARILAMYGGGRPYTEGPQRMETRLLRPDGDARWVWSTLSPFPGPNGERWTLATTQDITDRKTAELALAESEANLAAIAQVTRCMHTGADPRPVVVSAVHQLTGALTVTLVEQTPRHRFRVTAGTDPDQVGSVLAHPEGQLVAERWRVGDATLRVDTGDPRTTDPAQPPAGPTVTTLFQPVVAAGEVHALLVVTWQGHPVEPGGRAVRAVEVIADETGSCLQTISLRQELERSATTDPLTGLLNRRAWDLQLRQAVGTAGRTGRPLTVALIDLDRFKRYNDTHGHTAGDALLRKFSETVRSRLRQEDIFARWGGEEFILALQGTDGDQAEAVLGRVQASLPAGVTCSIGHTTWQPPEPISTSITRADSALYAAKAAGRNRIDSC